MSEAMEIPELKELISDLVEVVRDFLNRYIEGTLTEDEEDVIPPEKNVREELLVFSVTGRFSIEIVDSLDQAMLAEVYHRNWSTLTTRWGGVSPESWVEDDGTELDENKLLDVGLTRSPSECRPSTIRPSDNYALISELVINSIYGSMVEKFSMVYDTGHKFDLEYIYCTLDRYLHDKAQDAIYQLPKLQHR